MAQKFHSGIVGALLKSITLLIKHLTGTKGTKFHSLLSYLCAAIDIGSYLWCINYNSVKL